MRISPDGRELAALVASLPQGPGRAVLGIAGAPGAGKSTLATVVARMIGPTAAVVPLDGFHLADVELARQGLLDRKGAPETFDPWGYAALLRRLRSTQEHVVYAPGFERELEQPLAGAIAVAPQVRVVITEGNYLLLAEPGWEAAGAEMDAVWFVEVDAGTRARRLHARHVAFGKTPDEADAWSAAVDEPNAARVEATRKHADRVLDLSDWLGHPPRTTGAPPR